MKIYIYPTYTPTRDKSGNLYIKYFHESFEKDSRFKVLNRCWKIGIASMLFNIDAESFIIQWVDLIPMKKMGKIQFLFFLIIVSLAKMLRKRIIWVLHNKQSHTKKSQLVDYGMRFMARKADDVIVHSTEGIAFFNKMYPKEVGKCRYIPHPVYSTHIFDSSVERYDYIIWGSISRYKNVLSFVKYYNQTPFFANKTLLLCGRCLDDDYNNQIKLETCKNSNIDYRNEFLTDEELQELICQSRTILFTYNSESILSSGALIYSLNFCKPIIGPRVGNFVDMEGVVSCYDCFEDIPNIEIKFNPQWVKDYIEKNTWSLFPKNFMLTKNEKMGY